MQNRVSRVFCAGLAAIILVGPVLFAAVRGHKSMYVAGTFTECKSGQKGTIETTGTAFVFTPDMSASAIIIPYNSITAMDYGEHSGRRVGATIALGVTTLGIGALPVLFSKKKRHYLTIYLNKDPKAAEEQRAELAKNPKLAPKGDVASFEINKKDFADIMSVMQAKTGVTVEQEEVQR
jgi:hypothetical protein